ncbi:MAG: sensor histidine kinase [Saprospiraceae bacterium]
MFIDSIPPFAKKSTDSYSPICTFEESIFFQTMIEFCYLHHMTNSPQIIQSDQYKKWIQLGHLLFWVLFGGIMLIIYSGFVGGYLKALAPTLVNLTGLIILTYVHLWYLLPQFFDKKNYLVYGVLVFILLLLTTLFRFIVGWEIVRILGWELADKFTPDYFVGMIVTGLFLVLITIPLRLIENYFKKEELEQELKTQQLEAELRFLKAQVNPHFLFNALNNIYSLSFTNSSQTPEMILKLSDMMSYMLYDCKTEKVKLTNEINYLHNFIALQQLKKEGELNIEFLTKGDFSGIHITPMLFIPFFENAFKHGNLEDIQDGWLKSEMKVESGKLFFSIKNTTQKEKPKSEKGGVGLENVRARLNLLYPNRHKLEVGKKEGIFEVEIEVQL